MRILVLSQYFFPENFRVNDIVKELVKKGHIVTVLTGLPNYPEGRIYEGYEKTFTATSNYFGAIVYRCKLRPRKKGAINLALNYLSFIRQAKKTLKKIKPNFDVIYFYEPSPVFSGIPATWYGRKNNIKTVMYNLDIWPDCVRDSRGGKTMSKFNPIYLLSKIISKHVYNRFDLILNKCDEFGDYLHSLLNVSYHRMLTLFEHAEDTYLNVEEMPVANGIIDFMFLGNLGKVQNCDQMILAFSRMKEKNALLHFVGDGAYLDELIKLATRLHVSDRVLFHGRHSVEETIDYYNLADVCLLSLSNETASGLTPPTKLPGYMAACRPVVASIDGAAKTIIENAKCGFVCPSGDVDGLSAIMDSICLNPNCLELLGKNGRHYFKENFSLEKHINILEKALEDLIQGVI